MRPTQRSHLLTAPFAVGPDAFLSRRTALAFHGARRVNLHEIEVTVVAEHTPRLPDLRVHRARVAPEDHETRMVNGLRVASPSLALVEAAGRETVGEPLDHDESTLERDVAAWLAAIDPPNPAPERYVRIGPWEVDFHWPDHRLVLETDGEPYHLTPQELERDRVKDAWLQRRGLRVVRVSGFRFEHDRPGILGDLTAMLRAA